MSMILGLTLTIEYFMEQIINVLLNSETLKTLGTLIAGFLSAQCRLPIIPLMVCLLQYVACTITDCIGLPLKFLPTCYMMRKAGNIE